MKFQRTLGSSLTSMVVVGCLAAVGLVGCDRSRAEAVLKAQEGDKAVKANLDAAIVAYEEATKLDRNNHQIWNKLAQAQWKKADWAKTAEAFAGAIQADTDTSKEKKPTYANYFEGRGYALEQRARKGEIEFKEVEAPYLKCIEIDPNYASCYFGLGNTYAKLDQEQKALENYTKAIQHDPTQIMFYYPLGEMYVNLGYVKEAEAVLKEAKAFAKPDDQDPKNRQYLSNCISLLANILLDRGENDAAIKELEAAKASAPGDSPEAVRVLYGLGNVYANLGKKQDAIDNLKGFYQRACTNAQKKAMFEVECATVQSRVSGLGGTLN
jgi:tetratricopeptide (TPR) repeat protein